MHSAQLCKGGKKQWESPPEKPTLSACTRLRQIQVGRKQTESGLHLEWVPRALWRWVWSGWDGSGHGESLTPGALWDPCSHWDPSAGCQSSLKKPNPVDGLKEPNCMDGLKKSDPSPNSARDLMQHSQSISRNSSRLGGDA